jgi:16S rRNA (cytosine967-C5)-methyltransferase
MTPAARYAAAIEVLDRILAGQPAELALTNWGRANRFAGSGDRHALRDHVFDALRCKRSFAALGGAETGRGLILGALRAAGRDLSEVFSGLGHAPPPVGPDEAGRAPQGAEALDVPDWLYPRFQRALGADCDAVLRAMQARAPIYLRVNARKSTPAAALQALASDGIGARLIPGVKFGLEVIENARKVQNSSTYTSGVIELQDASSQAVVEALPLGDGDRVLDYCAGGGGKTLAMAARARLQVWAHDAAAQRMKDLPARASRAGVKITLTDVPASVAPFDLVLTDVPCSGSGSWRRDPQGKWALTEAKLEQTLALQAQILARAVPLVAAQGSLAYATCSLLREENEDQIDQFLAANPGWTCRDQRRFSPLGGGDGFFLALLGRG